MKQIILLLLLIVTVMSCDPDEKEPSKADFMPYSVGTYWVYQSDSGDIDTLMVVSNTDTLNGIKVDLNYEKWLVSNDSVYVRCNSRGGSEFIMPLYLDTKDSTEYGTCSGDVVTSIKAKNVGQQTINNKKYDNCIEYSGSRKKMLFAVGVGVIKYTHFDSDSNVVLQRTLKEFKHNK